MNQINISEDILPIGEFKAHASQVLRRLQNQRRPIVITQNGKPSAVLVSPEEFDTMREGQRFVEAIHHGLSDSEADRLVDDDIVCRELAAEFGPLSEQ